MHRIQLVSHSENSFTLLGDQLTPTEVLGSSN